MQIMSTDIDGLYIVKPKIIVDDRGYFEKIFSKKMLMDNELNSNFVDLNHSKTIKKGTFRGFHYQKPPDDEVKFIRCLKGKINDYVIDMRMTSKTFLKVLKVELSEYNQDMLYISSGLAHGFQTIEDNTEVIYFSSNYYSKENEMVINCVDPFFNISFDLEPILSEKDKQAPFVDNIKEYSV